MESERGSGKLFGGGEKHPSIFSFILPSGEEAAAEAAAPASLALRSDSWTAAAPEKVSCSGAFTKPFMRDLFYFIPELSSLREERNDLISPPITIHPRVITSSVIFIRRKPVFYNAGGTRASSAHQRVDQ